MHIGFQLTWKQLRPWSERRLCLIYLCGCRIAASRSSGLTKTADAEPKGTDPTIEIVTLVANAIAANASDGLLDVQTLTSLEQNVRSSGRADLIEAYAALFCEVNQIDKLPKVAAPVLGRWNLVPRNSFLIAIRD